MAGTEKNNLREQVAMLPLSPGVYQFVDRSGTIIYVGKAKSLRKRVSSYFVQSKEHSPKVRVLVKQIAEIRHIVVDSETDAHRVSEVLRLERQLVAEGALIIKLWLHLSREKQKKRLKALEHDPATRWRVRAQDWRCCAG